MISDDMRLFAIGKVFKMLNSNTTPKSYISVF